MQIDLTKKELYLILHSLKSNNNELQIQAIYNEVTKGTLAYSERLIVKLDTTLKAAIKRSEKK